MDAQNPAGTNGITSLSYGQDASRSDIDEILRRKRKAREYKACYPCRQRKVKCDQGVPCKTCRDRAHPELCTYNPPTETGASAKRVAVAPSNNGFDIPNGLISYTDTTVTISREDWDMICSKLHNVDQLVGDVKRVMGVVAETAHHNTTNDFSPATPLNPAPPSVDSDDKHQSTYGIHSSTEFGVTVHVGPSSVPAMVMALGRGENQAVGVQEVLGRKNLLPIFGLDNQSASYPFVDLWGLPHGSISRATELANALPPDTECVNFFRLYKATGHTLYPALADVEKFESELLMFLITRAGVQANENSQGGGVTEESIYGKSLHWIGLLFATLASGCQCSALPRKERELTSQVWVCCSFECLRFTNFLSHSTLESIQTLLILGNVISNNMNAGVAWSLLGLTIRLARSLGLHRACPPSTSMETKHLRSRTWWAVLWQDSLLSITYDRASSTMTIETPIPRSPHSLPGHRSYDESMYRLCKVGLDIVRERAIPKNSHDALLRITEHRNELQEIMFDAADYLKDSRRCRSMRDQLEHWALYLHVSYITSELCRPALSPNTSDHDLSKTVRKTCIDSLANTVEAYLGLQNVTTFASRSWAAVHRSLSSAVLLAILGEPGRNERARTLLLKYITILSDITDKVDPAERSAPITRSISALRKLMKVEESRLQQPQPQADDISSATTPSVGLFTSLDGSVTYDDPSTASTSPLIGLDMDQSPYALMDRIIWGSGTTP